MRMQKIKGPLFLLCVSLFSTGFCDKAASLMSNDGIVPNIVKEQPDKEHPDRQFKLMLPINVYDKNTSLNILIPKGFTIETMNSTNPKSISFIGHATAINVSFQIGGKYQPTKLLDEMIQALQALEQVTILESGNHGYFGYMDGYRLVTFSSPESKITHVYYMYVASGPYDSATVIYDMAVVGNGTVSSVAQKIKDDFNANIHIAQDK